MPLKKRLKYIKKRTTKSSLCSQKVKMGPKFVIRSVTDGAAGELHFNGIMNVC